jgi:putative ABC transport system permease protein
MFSNYFKIASRNLLKHKGYSLINITGLAIGMACCILIFLWVEDELSYDRFHENSGRIYRVIMNEDISGQSRRIWKTPAPLAPALKRDYPEIVNSCRYVLVGTWLSQTKDKSILQDNIALTDPEMFEMFSIPFTQGEPSISLSDPNSIVLTKSFARKYFGDNNPIGEIVKIDGRMEFNVTGVIEDPPSNSNFRFS